MTIFFSVLQTSIGLPQAPKLVQKLTNTSDVAKMYHVYSTSLYILLDLFSVLCLIQECGNGLTCIADTLSRTACIKSSCPAIRLVTTENWCHLYLSNMLSIAAVWCSSEGANWSWSEDWEALLSSPELSAFHAITGMPKYPANCRKYWADAVLLPYCS